MTSVEMLAPLLLWIIIALSVTGFAESYYMVSWFMTVDVSQLTKSVFLQICGCGLHLVFNFSLLYMACHMGSSCEIEVISYFYQYCHLVSSY
jgi:hypothetical protein